MTNDTPEIAALRKRFEEWHRKQAPYSPLNNEGGKYGSYLVEDLWQAFQAGASVYEDDNPITEEFLLQLPEGVIVTHASYFTIRQITDFGASLQLVKMSDRWSVRIICEPSATAIMSIKTRGQLRNLIQALKGGA